MSAHRLVLAIPLIPFSKSVMDSEGSCVQFIEESQAVSHDGGLCHSIVPEFHLV